VGSACSRPSQANTLPCYTPLKAYRAPGGQIKFDSKSGWADRPLTFRCGHCIGCRQDLARSWAIRIMHESLMHANNCFITLTYDDDHLPDDGGLQVDDYQRFTKRLRKNLGPFRYYHCGEYGPNTHRPHYHACLFGLDFASDRVLLRRTKQSDLYTSPLLQQTWGLGTVTVGNLTYESAEYVARYCMKKLTGNAGAEEYGDLRPPYSSMSLKPGLGSAWFDKYHRDVYPADEVVHKGRRFRPPKYYDGKLEEAALRELKMKRLKHMNTEEQTERRLRIREQVHLARLNAQQRKL